MNNPINRLRIPGAQPSSSAPNRWTHDKPTTVGFFWCFQRGEVRMVSLWSHKPGGEIFTNEDYGASINDEIYDGAQWMAAQKPPAPKDNGAQPVPSFADAYQGAMEEVAIWKKRALEAEDLNRKFIAEINGPMLVGEPSAQPQLNEIKITLQRALELGQRETWTGARKHRSWEDQREEQQCWNKVWSLLGAKGEEK